MPGLKGRAAVAGVASTRFGEHWDSDSYDLLAQACRGAVADAGLSMDEIEAGWVGIAAPFTGTGGAMLADAVRMFGKPITRVENFCATGMDAFRNACFAVAAGVYDVALACGVEKLRDQGASGLPAVSRPDPVLERPAAPALFALAATRSFSEYGWDEHDLAEVAVKNHANGAKHPLAHLRSEITVEQALAAPPVAEPLKRFDCSAISDGAAAVVVTRPEVARGLNHHDALVTVQACAFAVTTAHPHFAPGVQWVGFPATQKAAAMAYEEAGISNPLEEIDVVECHDCFTITELLNLQDLGFCETGTAARFTRDGHTRADGELPVNPSGGLKCFGHPIGATGCRMIYEITSQLQGRAAGVQVADSRIGLAHNLGGPGSVGAITILARED
jgi:acetyl-CoA C-acetyltransferase